MSFLGFIPIVDKVLGITQSLIDPDKKEKAFHVAFQKNGRKALNIAEDIFELIDENLSDLPEKIKKKYLRLKRKFNDLD